MTQHRNTLIIVAAGALALIVAGCDQSETIAPDGSTVTINANPAQVILAGTPALQVNPISIVATVRNSIGVPLPGQDVRFTTTSGSLTPPALQPVTTDDLGNATCELSNATTGPNITATSGKATASLQLTSANGQVAQILLNSDATDLTDCADTFTLTATALDGTGKGVSGFTIIFQFAPTNPANAFTGNFNPTQGVSDTDGIVTSTLSLNSTTCNSNCVGAGKDCRARIRAVSNGNLIISTELEILDQIP
jgi:hypothetical protein